MFLCICSRSIGFVLIPKWVHRHDMNEKIDLDHDVEGLEEVSYLP